MAKLQFASFVFLIGTTFDIQLLFAFVVELFKTCSLPLFEITSLFDESLVSVVFLDVFLLGEFFEHPFCLLRYECDLDTFRVLLPRLMHQ